MADVAPSSMAATGRLAGWRTRDLIVAAALAVPLGLVWSFVWGQVWLWGRGLSPQLGIVLTGFYVVGGVLVGYILRRPGAALLGEMLAALLEIPFTPFGAVALWLGFIQGAGVEAVFAATRYRRWDLPVLILAGAVGAAAMFVLYEYTTFGYSKLGVEVQVLNLALKLIGGALFAGLAGKLIADALAQTGVLDNFPIGRGRRAEV